MARIVTTSVGTTGQYTAWIDSEVISQSIANNSSYIVVRSYVQRNDGYSGGAYNLNGVYRNTKYDWSNEVGITAPFDTRNGALVLVKETYYTISHDAEGKKTVYLSSYCHGVSGTSLPAYEIGGNYDLPTIPRKSTCSFSDFTIGDNIVVNINRASASFTHTLKLYINGVLITTKTDVGASITIDPTDPSDYLVNKMYEACPNTATPQTKIVCTTYSGATNLGYTETIRTATVRYSDSKPLFSNFVVADSNAITNALGTDFIKGFSNAKITISGSDKAVAQNYATMISYVITIGDAINTYLYSTETFEATINNMSNKVITVKAVDSRGYDTIVNKTVPFLDYSSPIIQKVGTERLNGVETTTYLSLKAIIWDGNFTNGSNKVAYFGYRTKVNDMWSNWFDITTAFNSKATLLNGNVELDISDELSIHSDGLSGGFPVGTAFDIEVKLSDGITSQVFNYIIGSATVTDGIILDGHYKDNNGEYHSGYHCMPTEDYNHSFCGTMSLNGKPINNIIELEELPIAGEDYINNIYKIGDKLYICKGTGSINRRNIQVGDNLNGKIIYCDFPEDLQIPILPEEDPPYNKNVVETNAIDASIYEYSQAIPRETWKVVSGDGIVDLYYKGTRDEEVVSYKNLTSYELPSNFGTVVSIDIDGISYQYMKIDAEDTIYEWVEYGQDRNFEFYKFPNNTVLNATTTTVSHTSNITTKGRPIYLSVSGDNNPLETASCWFRVQFYRDDTLLAQIICQSNVASQNIPFALTYLDDVVAGNYNYECRFVRGGGSMTLTEEGNYQAPNFSIFEI